MLGKLHRHEPTPLDITLIALAILLAAFIVLYNNLTPAPTEGLHDQQWHKVLTRIDTATELLYQWRAYDIR